MPGSEFDDFVRRQQAKSQEAKKVDPAQQISEWRDALTKLYGDIEGYMADYLANSQAKIQYRDVELNEDFSGPYSVRQMELSIGPSVILFKPIGTMLIGAKGRVDVQGPLGSARLVFMDRKVEKAQQLFRVTVSVGDALAPPPSAEDKVPTEWVWKIATPAPSIRFTDLNKDAFFEMILSIADA